jgi:hypothetical protein
VRQPYKPPKNRASGVLGPTLTIGEKKELPTEVSSFFPYSMA